MTFLLYLESFVLFPRYDVIQEFPLLINGPDHFRSENILRCVDNTVNTNLQHHIHWNKLPSLPPRQKAHLAWKVLVYPVNISPELRVLGNDQRGRVALLVEPEQAEAATDCGDDTDDDGGLGVGRHQRAVPTEKSLQSTDDSILTATNWKQVLKLHFIIF